MVQRFAYLGILRAGGSLRAVAGAGSRRDVLDLAAARRAVARPSDGRADGAQRGSDAGRRAGRGAALGAGGRTGRPRSDPRRAGSPGRVHAAGERLAAGARGAAARPGRAARAQLPADAHGSAAAGEPRLQGPQGRAAAEPADLRRADPPSPAAARVVGCPRAGRRARASPRATPANAHARVLTFSVAPADGLPPPHSSRTVAAYVLPGQARTWTLDNKQNDRRPPAPTGVDFG